MRPVDICTSQPWFPQPIRSHTYRSARNRHLDLAARSAHQLAELGANALEEAQTVVLGQGLEEVLDGGVGASGLLELGDDGGLVGGGQGRGVEDGGQLGVLGDQAAQLVQGGGGRVERGGLDGRGVLFVWAK